MPTMKDDGFNVMNWSGSFDGPWTREAEDKYKKGRFNGLALTTSMNWTPADLKFLHEPAPIRRASKGGGRSGCVSDRNAGRFILGHRFPSCGARDCSTPSST